MPKWFFNDDATFVGRNTIIAQPARNRAKEVWRYGKVKGTHRVRAYSLGQNIPTPLTLCVNRRVGHQRQKLIQELRFVVAIYRNGLSQAIAELVVCQLGAGHTQYAAITVKLASNKPMKQPRPNFAPCQITRRSE